MALLEGGKEGGAIDAVERLAGPVEDLFEVHGAQLLRISEVLVELGEDGDVQIPGRLAPAEARLGVCGRLLLAPEDPGGEQTVEEGLHERGAEEVLAALALEGHAQCLLQGLARGDQSGELAAFLDTGTRLAGVAGQEPGEFLWRRDLRRAQHDALEELCKALAGRPGSHAARMRGQCPELALGGC